MDNQVNTTLLFEVDKLREELERKNAEIEQLKKHPTNPAITEEVLVLFTALLAEEEKRLRFVQDTSEDTRDTDYAADNLQVVKAARDWLTKCPTATDKAVCPKCGGRCREYPMDTEACCYDCGHVFKYQVLIISPPREPKVTP